MPSFQYSSELVEATNAGTITLFAIRTRSPINNARSHSEVSEITIADRIRTKTVEQNAQITNAPNTGNHLAGSRNSDSVILDLCHKIRTQYRFVKVARKAGKTLQIKATDVNVIHRG
jgi:hypothetical protein